MPLTNVFRTDGWVKSTLGPAVPGAQVYVCLQPANVGSLPPTPLANIFSDVNGLVPITQPILTDGFGHYDFYAPAGVYTVIIGLAGLVQQVYPDQSVGGASGTGGGGGGTALVLQTNGVQNGNQLLLNLIGSNSVAVSDNGSGSITIIGPTFQTDGVDNTLQSKYNLKAGSNIVLTADALGGVTIDGAAQGVSFATPGQGWFAGPGMTDASSILMNSATDHITNIFGPITSTTVVVFQFVLQAEWTISKAAYQLTATGAPSSTFTFGIYDSSKSKAVDAGLFDGNTTALQINTFTAVVLPPGTYYFACNSTDSGAHGPCAQVGSVPVQLFAMINASSSLWAYASNPTVAGVLPSTLGTLTNSSGANTDSLPLPIWLV